MKAYNLIITLVQTATFQFTEIILLLIFPLFFFSVHAVPMEQNIN